MSNRVLAVIRSKNREMRYAPMNSVVMAAFETLCKNGDSHSGHVFLNANGERLTGLRYWFEPAIKKAKIKDFTWHCLRHTFASRLTMKEVGLRSVQDLMGQDGISDREVQPLGTEAPIGRRREASGRRRHRGV